MQEDVLLPSRNRLEGSLTDTPLKALLEPCRKHQVTGTIRVTSREGRGALQLRGGVVEHATFGMLVGDAAVIRMSLLREGSYELQQRAPDLNGQLGKAAAFESDVTRVPLNVIMKHIEQHALNCTLTVQSQYDRGELRYRGGHLLEVLLNGVSEEEALAKVTRWAEASYKVELDGLAPEIMGWPKMRRAETQPFVLENMAPTGTAPIRAPQKKKATSPGMPGVVPQGGMSTSPSGPVQVMVMPHAKPETPPPTSESGLILAGPTPNEGSGPKKRPPPPPARTPRGSIPPSPAPRSALAEATPQPGPAPSPPATEPVATTKLGMPPPAAKARGTGSVEKVDLKPEPRADESNPLAAFDPLAMESVVVPRPVAPAPVAVPEAIPVETSAHVSTKAKIAAARAVGSSPPGTPAPQGLPAPASLTRSSQPMAVPSRPTTVPPTMTAPRRTTVPPVAVMPGTPALALPRAASVDPFVATIAPPAPAMAQPYPGKPRKRDHRVLYSALILAVAIGVLAAAMWFFAEAAQTARKQHEAPGSGGALPLAGVVTALEAPRPEAPKLEPAPTSTARPRGTYPSTREDAPRGRRGRRR